MQKPNETTTPLPPCQPGLYHALDAWTKTLATHLPHLSQPQIYVLALWSLGMVLARACGLTSVAGLLAAALKTKENTMRQRLREWYQEAQAKRGEHRTELDVRHSFAPLLAWVLSGWQGTQLALALDATTLGQRFVVLAVSVVYRGCAIPVAWKILPATEKHAWRAEWLRLLKHLRPAIPAHLFVIVLADRGLYARWLFRRIVRLGWHPFLRVNLGGQFCPAGENRFRPLKSFVPTIGTQWAGQGTAFKTKAARLKCTLLARWEAGYTDPWLILTDLSPDCADAAWYGLRAWIEQGFKITKRAGWQWQQTRMTDPQRAARLWLAVAVATLWLLSVGGEAEAEIPESTFLEALFVERPSRKRRRSGTHWRLVSVFRRGWQRILVAIINHAPLPCGTFIPEAWPTFEANQRGPDFNTPVAEAGVLVCSMSVHLEVGLGAIL